MMNRRYILHCFTVLAMVYGFGGTAAGSGEDDRRAWHDGARRVGDRSGDGCGLREGGRRKEEIDEDDRE